MRRTGLGAAIGAVAIIGCQLIVPSDPPDFSCASTLPSACPSGLTCDVAQGKCVASVLVDADVPDADTDGDVVDAAGDVADAISPLALGEACRVDNDCQSKLCGTSTILTTSIVTAGTLPICTKTCCVSTDCPAGFVCFGPGTGGNYCVAAPKAQRTVPATGGKAPGQTCANNGECRSGLCSGTRCVDTCCLPSDCAAGTTCRVTSVAAPAPAHDIWACSAPAGGATKNVGDVCVNQTDCKNNDCIGQGASRTCRPTCCSAAACTGQGFGASPQCAYSASGTDQLKYCEPTTTGAAALGANCNDRSDCQSAFCDPETQKCANVCCSDADCPQTQVCRPSATSTPFLRCVKGGR